MDNRYKCDSAAALVTHDIPTSEIPGLYSSDNHNLTEVKQRMTEMTKEFYSLDEIFGQYCHLAVYIEAPPEMTFEYAANVYSLKEWTFSMRDFCYVGGGVYKSKEKLAANTYVYTKVMAYPDSGVVDYLCAWDQGSELWMRYYFRVIDAMPTLRKPGSVVLWTNCRHPYYDRDAKNLPPYIAEGQERTDREWVGDFWMQFDAIHKIELNNLKTILEYRYNAISNLKD